MSDTAEKLLDEYKKFEEQSRALGMSEYESFQSWVITTLAEIKDSLE